MKMSSINQIGVIALTVLAFCGHLDRVAGQTLPPREKRTMLDRRGQPVQRDPQRPVHDDARQPPAKSSSLPNGDVSDDVVVVDLQMPGVRTEQDDEYVCSAWKVPVDKSYITQLEALTTTSSVRQMVLYGCEETESSASTAWKQCHNACRTTSSNNILFTWARNVPPTRVPKDVGFPIGRETPVRYLVLQIHYGSSHEGVQLPDRSGFRITATTKRPNYLAGIFILLVNSLVIPAHSKKTYGDVSCVFDDDVELHPFGFRVHSHELGRVVSGYQVQNGSWNLIEKGNPHWPQVFFPIQNAVTIKKSDVLVARCTYDATHRRTATRIGPTQDDEMCNFYMMYFTNATGGRSFYSCSGNNVPDLLRKIPSDAEVPLPPNPVLDDIAAAAGDVGGGGGGGENGVGLAHSSSSSSSSSHSFPGNKGSKPTERRHHDDRLYRYRGASGGGAGGGAGGAGGGSSGRRDGVSGLVETERNFMDGAASDDVVRARNPYADYRIQKDDPVEWTARSGRDPSAPLESDYVNLKRPEEEAAAAAAEGDLAYEYAGVPDVGAATDDNDDQRLLQDYVDEVAGQRSRYRHRYPIDSPSGAAAAYNRRDPLSKYGVGMSSSSRDEEEGEDANRRRLYPEEYDVGSQGYDARSRDVDPRTGSDELQRMGRPGSSSGPGSTVVSDNANQNSTSTPESAAMIVVKDWPRLGELVLGEVTGVATDSAGSVYVFHRGSRQWTSHSFDIHNRYRRVSEGPIPEDTVVVLTGDSGHVTGQWGRDLFSLPHGITVDHLNRVWLTDVAMHQVMRFQMPETQKPDLTLGVRFEPGSDKFHFCQPTAVAVSSSGTFYIADGYCNSRILMFSKDGNYLREWGERSRRVLADGFPAASTFDVVHGLTILEDRQMLCAADRDNSRVQCFNIDSGQFVCQMHPPQLTGRLVAVSYCRSNGQLYAINGHDSYGRARLRIFIFDPVTGRLLNFSRITGEELFRPHALATSADCRYLHIAHIEPNRVWKIPIHEEGPASSQWTVSNSPVPPSPSPSKTVHSVETLVSLGVRIDKSSLQINEAEEEEEKHADVEEETDFGVSLAIGGLLIVPVSTIAVITLLMRLRKSGKCRLFGHRYRNRRYSLSSLLSRRSGSGLEGFDRLRTDDNANHDELEHLHINNSDSDIDDVVVAATTKHLKA